MADRQPAGLRQGVRAGLPLLSGGMLLGLIATTAGITLLEYLIAPSGQGPTLANVLGLFLPTCAALALVLLLTCLHTRRERVSSRRLGLLLTIVGAAAACRLLPLPWNMVLAIASYGVVVHARLVCGREQARLVAGALTLGFLPIGPGASAFLPLGSYGIWLVGLLFLYSLISQGSEERAARQQSEEAVRALSLAQEQLRAQAVRAEDLAVLRERTRLARELHDTLAQGLAAIAMHLDSGDALFATQPDRARAELRRARAIAGTQLQETRASVLALRVDDGLGLPLTSALAVLVAAWRPWPGAPAGQATFHADAAVVLQAYLPAVEVACYRVAQEALHNAARHSRAQHVVVELSREPQGACLTVTDDGCGFDPALVQPRPDGGWGLIGLRERMALLGGQLEVITAPGAGTQIMAQVPLDGPTSALRQSGG